MHNCALRNKLLVVALVIISSVTETKPPEFELSDEPLNLSSAVDIGYPKFPERFC
jgi:hypothetical protein